MAAAQVGLPLAPARRVEFTVAGTPAPKGSKKHVGNGILVESSKKAKPWEAVVSLAAAAAMAGRAPFGGPVRVIVDFYLARPKGHYLRGQLRATAPRYCTSHGKGDGDKLTRCSWDGLIGIVIADDALIALWGGGKFYSDDGRTGARIVVEELRP